MAIRYPITLSTTEPNNNIGLLKIRQADEETQTLVVDILEHGVPLSYEGLQVFFCAKIGQSEGLGIVEQKLLESEMTDPKSGKLEYTMRAQDWQILGRQLAYFSFRKMTDDHTFIQQFTTRDFTYEVTKNVFSDGSKQIISDGSTYIWTIEDLIRLFNEYIATGKTDWEEFIEQNKEIIESVDPGGLVLTELIESRKNADGQVFPRVYERLNSEFGKLSDFRPENPSVISKFIGLAHDRYPDARAVGVKADGETDDTNNIKNAIEMYKRIVLPVGGTVNVTDTIQLREGQGIIAHAKSIRGYAPSSTIKYVGEKDNHKAVLLLGKNAVDAAPELDGTDIRLENIIIDANNLAGFAAYGTYLTNETILRELYLLNSLEYNGYFARSWYAFFEKLISIHSRGSGLAFGMPLDYLEEPTVDWSLIGTNLEMNGVTMRDLRSRNSGTYFSVEKPGTYKPTGANKRKGYGIGAGTGNAFFLEHFVTEQSGGVNLYSYTGSQPVKKIAKGYSEQSCLNSGLNPASEVVQLLLENSSPTGGTYHVDDLFLNYSSGGILHTGETGRAIRMRNVQQPRFINSTQGLSTFQLNQLFLKENVYSESLTYNTDPGSLTLDSLSTVNTRYSFQIEPAVTGVNKIIYAKAVNDGAYGTIVANYDDGTTENFTLPTDLATNRYTQIGVAKRTVTSFTKGGVTGATDKNILVKILNAKPSWY